MLLYKIYQVFITLLVILIFPFVYFGKMMQKDASPGLAQRLGIGLQQVVRKRGATIRIWIHAASVGEVQAAMVLIQELRERKPKIEFFLSTMTTTGLWVASSRQLQDVYCSLAPIDAVPVVRRFISIVRPDVYVCLETELWPAMFIELSRQRIPALVINGRLTPRSLHRYRKVPGIMEKILGSLSGLGVISAEDGQRFHQLGAKDTDIHITGNIKYDYPEVDQVTVREKYRKLLHVDSETVFICGSTRTGEEQKLLQVYNQLRLESNFEVVWVIAPRHLDRLDEVQELLISNEIQFDLFSKLKDQKRFSTVVLVDTFGDLSNLYSAGDLNFVGGSLVKKRGQNIMEAARWSRPVYYGSSIEDFKDAAEVLENTGGGFRVRDENALGAVLINHLRKKEKYNKACAGAAQAVKLQRGAAKLQGDMILEKLPAASATV